MDVAVGTDWPLLGPAKKLSKTAPCGTCSSPMRALFFLPLWAVILALTGSYLGPYGLCFPALLGSVLMS